MRGPPGGVCLLPYYPQNAVRGGRVHGEGRSEFGSPGEEVGEEGGRVLVISPATNQEEVGGPEEGGRGG